MITFTLQLVDLESNDVHNYNTGIPTLVLAKRIFNENLQLAIEECYGCNHAFNRVLNPTIWRLIDSNGNEIERVRLFEQNDKTKPVNLKGGRGEKAPYQTTHVRVPIDLKPLIDKLVNEYRQAVVSGNEQQYLDNLNQLTDKRNTENELQAVIDVIKDFKESAKTTRDWTQANKLISRLVEVLEDNE